MINKIYEKILLFSKISRLLFHCDDLQSLNKINIKYFIVSECKENTIIGKAKKLYDDFVKKLTEDSKVFPYLLNLDSGASYYENEMVYTFDMTNLELMKFHLSKICPKIIVFYKNKNTVIGNIHKNVPCMGVNLCNFLKDYQHKKIFFNKAMKKNKEIADDIAIDLFILTIHENMGHFKFSYNKNKCKSPKRIINESNKLVELKNSREYKEDGSDNEYILSKKSDEGDSGHFLELAFGKFKNYLILDIILKIKGKGNLLKRADLFTDSELQLLKKYSIMKVAAEKKKIKIEKKDTIEDEINEMEKYISYDNIVSNKTISNKTKSNNDVYQVKEKNTSLNETKNLNENKKEKRV